MTFGIADTANLFARFKLDGSTLFFEFTAFFDEHFYSNSGERKC